MSSHVNVDTSSVRTSSAGFDSAGMDAISLINDALYRLNKFDGVWGRDETGKQFEMVYSQPRDGLIQGLEAIPMLLQNYSGGMGSTAAIYERTNDLAVDLVQNGPRRG